jgi:pilus assembly protein CpaC
VYKQRRIAKAGRRSVILPQCENVRTLVVLVLLFSTLTGLGASAQTIVTNPNAPSAVVPGRPSATTRDLGNMIAQTAPSSHFASAQPPNRGEPIAPGPILPPPPPPLPGAPLDAIPRVVPLEPPGVGSGLTLNPTQPRVIQFPRDATGLIPDRPPGPSPIRSNDQVARDVNNLIQFVQEPEAELSVKIGQSQIIQSRRVLRRVAIANPLVADIELLADQPNSRLLNLYGKSFGTTTLTIWDEDEHSVSFLVRVTLDTKDLESRIRQAFPGAEVKVRQVGPQVILDGQVPDSKTMADVIQLVSFTVMISQMGIGAAGGGTTVGGAGGGGTMAGGGGATGGGGAATGGGGTMGGGGGAMGGGGGVGVGGAAGAVGRGLTIINRVTVPGPRQILLHVKIAEINRSATRDIGVSWLYGRGKSIIGSAIGNNSTLTVTGNAGYSSVTGPRALTGPATGTFSSTSSAAPGPSSQLFGIFQAGHFSLFIDALRSNSLAKILAEPNLVALDGQPARFLVGGMFPFPVPQSSSIPGGTAVVTVQFQRFGTILTFLPQILPNDVIRLDVEPIISQLNFAQGTTVGTGVVPSITERSARTVVELREGQTLAIAGLLQSITNASTVRVPGLGDLPLVGPWFSANATEVVETETIVLVTPELVAPLDKKEVTEAPGDRVYQPSDPEFYLLGRIEGKLGREFRATVGQQDPLNLMKHYQSEQQWVIGAHGHAD